MGLGGDSESEEASSQSWPETEIGEPATPPSPEVPVRRTFSHYTQVRHNGYLTKRFKQADSWSRQFCTVHGNILRCFAGRVQYSDGEDPLETIIIRGVRAWEAEYNKAYNRGLLIDCEGGDTIIARTDTSAEQEEWTEALGTVTALLGNNSGAGGRGGGYGVDVVNNDNDDIDAIDDDDDDELAGGRIQTTYLAQKDALLLPEEATGPCTVVFQVVKATLRRVDDTEVGKFNNGDVYLVMHAMKGDIANSAGGGVGGVGDPGGASGTITRTLFYWVGSKASMDKGTVACIKAVELRRALPGPCSIRREDETQESPEFLVLFDEVTVAEEESGARVLTKVKRWSELPPIMYSVRVRVSASAAAAAGTTDTVTRNPPANTIAPQQQPRRLNSAFTVGRIDLDEDHLGSDRVLLVDDRNGQVYLWCGSLSTFKHRGFGLEAASALKSDNPKGGQVVQVDEDDEPPELRRILDRARKQRLLELQVRAAEGDEHGAEEQGAEQRRMVLMGASAEGVGPAVSLFRVTQIRGGGDDGGGAGYDEGDASLQLSLVACTSREYIAEILGNELEPEQDGNPMLSMMETDAAFILDVYTEIFVWYGDGAERAARRGAGKVAHQLLRAVPRPRWAEDITHVRQAREPFLFRVKFFDWGVAGRRGVGVTGRAAEPVNCLTSFHKAVRTIAEVKHDPDAEVEKRLTDTLRGGQSEDLPFPVDAMVEAAGAGADEGYGQLLMWRVHPRGLVTVPEEEFGHMQSSHSYVLLYGYDAAEELGEEDSDDGTDNGSSSDADSVGLSKTGGDMTKRGSFSVRDGRNSHSRNDRRSKNRSGAEKAGGNGRGHGRGGGDSDGSSSDRSILARFDSLGEFDDDEEEDDSDNSDNRQDGNNDDDAANGLGAGGGRSRSRGLIRGNGKGAGGGKGQGVPNGGVNSSSKKRAGGGSLAIPPTSGVGGGADGNGGAGAGGAGGAGNYSTSRRKTMFAKMKRESMVGTLKQVGGKHGGGREGTRRVSSGSDDSDEETFERIGIMALEEEDEDSDDADGYDDNDDRGSVGGARRKAGGTTTATSYFSSGGARNKSSVTNKSKSKRNSNSNRAGINGVSVGDASPARRRRRPRQRSPGVNSDSESNNDADDDDEAVSVISASSDAPAAVGGGGGEGGEEEEDYDDELEYSDDGEFGGGVGDAEPRFLIYFWAGSRARKSDWVLWKLELAKTMIPEWQKALNTEIPQIQVTQGQEPRHFRRMFGQGRDHGRLIVHDRVWRKRDNPEKRVALFKVQRVPDGGFQAFQVPPHVGSLNSLDVFVIICTVVTDDWVGNNDEAVYFWVGTHATIALQEHGAKVLMALMEYYCMPADFKVSILEEDELYDDHDELWTELSEMLGGEVAWAKWTDDFDEDFDADEDLGCVPKLYTAYAGSGDVSLSYLGAVQQGSLTQETLAVLDTVEGVYVWRGVKADTSHHRQIYRACETYCWEKSLRVGRKVIGVQEGQEPLVFRARFEAWDDGGPGGGTKVFQDVYEQRVVQMSKEGTLGDMSALIGRVLDDDEAAKYWKSRGAEPGGTGGQNGLFRDDPASRSTQRRGAPGRKPWVKPPPKPVEVIDKAKELEAKRTFQELKDRFEGPKSEAFTEAKPVKPTFSRRNMIKVRQESIREGHVNRFQAAGELERRGSVVGSDDDVFEDDEPGDGEMRRLSWGSSSSARRRHAEKLVAQAASAAKRAAAASAELAAATPPRWPSTAPAGTATPTSSTTMKAPSSVPRPARRSKGKGSMDSAAASRSSSWEAPGDGRSGSWSRRSRSGVRGNGSGGARIGGSAPVDGNVTRSGGIRGSLDSAAGSTSDAVESGLRGSQSLLGVERVSSGKGGSGGGGDIGEMRRGGSAGGRVDKDHGGDGGVSSSGIEKGQGPDSLEFLSADSAGSSTGRYTTPPQGVSPLKEDGVVRNSSKRESGGGDRRERPGSGSGSGAQTRKELTQTRLQGGQDGLRSSTTVGSSLQGAEEAVTTAALTATPTVSARSGRELSDAKELGGERHVRSRSGSIIDNEELLEALEQVAQEERRLSRTGPSSATTTSPSVPISAGAAPRGSSTRQRSSARSRSGSGSGEGIRGGGDRKENVEDLTSRGDVGGKGGSGSRSRRGSNVSQDSGKVSVGEEDGRAGDSRSRSRARARTRGGEGDTDSMAVSYRRALARVRRETVQEGLRQGHVRDKVPGSGTDGRLPADSDQHVLDVSSPDDEARISKKPESARHAMSRVKGGRQRHAHAVGMATATVATAAPGGGGGSPATAAGAREPRGGSGRGEMSRQERAVSAAEAIAARRTSVDSSAVSEAGEGGDDDDDDHDEDEDSPRNRGRKYDNRWKAPGHAESVLAEFVERLEHRGHHASASAPAVAAGVAGLSKGAGEHGGASDAAAALAEARANRGAAIAVLGNPHRAAAAQPAAKILVPPAGEPRSAERSTQAVGISSSTSKKKRRDSGGGEGRNGRDRREARRRSAGKRKKEREKSSAVSAATVVGGGKGGGVAAGAGGVTAAGGNGSGSGNGTTAGGGGGGGAWSRFGSLAVQSLQRAAEALVGAPKDVPDGGDDQVSRIDQERTRDAASAFLSSSRRRQGKE